MKQGFDLEMLAAIYAFGATLAFTIVHLAVIRLRFTEPDRPTLEVRSLGPDRMSLTWTSSDGQRSDIAELHRLR